MVNTGPVHVEVVYALQDRAQIISLDVPEGTTLQKVIERSGILKQFPDIDLTRNRIGVFSKLKAPEEIVKNGDRIEIYRPLKANPKESRRKRAGKPD